MNSIDVNIKNCICLNDTLLIEAMKIIDNNSLGVVYVIDSNNRLLGSLTDGDIRRWLLKSGSLNDLVEYVMNSNPKFIMKQDVLDSYTKMDEFSITSIPVVDENKCIIDIVTRRGKHIQNCLNTFDNIPLVMMAGGKGTRLSPYTNILPKPLIPINEKPISELIIDEFSIYGCNIVYMIVNYKKNMIKAYFNDTELSNKIHFIEENKALGTGGGVKLLAGIINSTFILSNCDILISEDYNAMLNFHKENNNLVTMICSMKSVSIPYGVVEIGDNGKLIKMTEKPNFSFLANTGMYIVEPQIFNFILDEENVGFTDIIDRVLKKGANVGVYPISENSWYDMGQFDEFDRMAKFIDKRKAD